MLRPNEHYIHIDADHAKDPVDPHLATHVSKAITVPQLCQLPGLVQQWVQQHPAAAACIGAKGQAVVQRWLTEEAVHDYMASILLEMAGLQDGAVITEVIPSSVWFIDLGNLLHCVQLARSSEALNYTSHDSGHADNGIACVAAAVSAALTKKRAAAEAAANGELKRSDQWLVR